MLSQVMLVLLIVVAVGSGFLFFLMGYCRSIGRWLHGTPVAKYTVEAIQFIVGIPVVYRGFGSVEQKDHWFPASIAALVSLVMWRFVLIRAELIGNAAKKDYEGEIDDLQSQVKVAKQEGTAQAGLLAILCQLVDLKTKRIQSVGQENGVAGRRISTAEKALNPKLQINDILQATIRFCTLQLPRADSRTSFRVAFYLERDGYLQKYHDATHFVGSPRPFSSFETHRRHFCLDNSEWPAQAVRCVQENKLIIVSDCAAAAEAGTFRFFREAQKEYLCSLVAFPLSGAVDKSGKPLRGSVVIDTDRPGFFSEERKDLLQLCMRCLVARLSLELSLLVIVDKR